MVILCIVQGPYVARKVGLHIVVESYLGPGRECAAISKDQGSAKQNPWRSSRRTPDSQNINIEPLVKS